MLLMIAAVVVILRYRADRQWLLRIGSVVTAVIAVQLVQAPPALGPGEDFGYELTPGVGAWLGLGGALAILAAGFLIPTETERHDDPLSD